MTNEIHEIEKQIWELNKKLARLRSETKPVEVKNYSLRTLEGETTLLDLFGDKEILFAIHNMGQGCRYCTLWADGFNAFLPHLEDKFAIVLMSKDRPEAQRRFANSRGWRFRMVSHSGGEYIRDHSAATGGRVGADASNDPGLVCYQRKGDKIFRKNTAEFGPGDTFCAIWHLLSLAGFNEENWTPQFNYWKAIQTLDDGGKNLL